MRMLLKSVLAVNDLISLNIKSFFFVIDNRPATRSSRYSTKLGLRDIPSGGLNSRSTADTSRPHADGRPLRRVLDSRVRREDSLALADSYRNELPCS